MEHLLKQYLKSTQREFKAVKSEAAKHRFKFLREQKAKALANHDNSAANNIEKIIRSEIMKLTFRKLSKLVKGTQSGTLDRVVLTDPATNTQTEITDEKDLFDALFRRNINHFG